MSRQDQIQKDLETYFGFGDKGSGGAGDEASGRWLMGQLEAVGYACERQVFEVPTFEGPTPMLICGDTSAAVIPQAIVVPTGPDGLVAPLRLAGSVDTKGAIVLLSLPWARWSSVKGEVERRIHAELNRGAAAVVLITTGPTGDALALNAPVDAPLFDRPVAVLAPKAARPFLAAAQDGHSAILKMAGRSSRRPAFNVCARLDRGVGRTLTLSTPRSGWFGCAGERGPGVAVWLALARWGALASLKVDLALVATSGHEYENAGADAYIRDLAPRPEESAAWIHLGANLAARDWHELGGTQLSPLPSADPQRFLLATPSWLPQLRSAFSGQPGLEQPYPADPEAAAGELTGILKAGYTPAIGILGAHRFHHSQNDDLRCVSSDLVARVVESLREVIASRFAG